jgi:hypothetical protein
MLHPDGSPLQGCSSLYELWSECYVSGSSSPIDDWFEAKKLKRVANNFNAEQFPSSSVNEATDLCYEFGDLMGLDRRFIENTIDVTGNPISALRLLASLAKEARRIDTLVAQGKLRLPEQI